MPLLGRWNIEKEKDRISRINWIDAGPAEKSCSSLSTRSYLSYESCQLSSPFRVPWVRIVDDFG
jgi:hypothetical protein